MNINGSINNYNKQAKKYKKKIKIIILPLVGYGWNSVEAIRIYLECLKAGILPLIRNSWTRVIWLIDYSIHY